MIRALIIDDEPHSITSLLHELESIKMEIEILGTYTSATEGLKAITKFKPDLVFLDVDMPVVNGFEMLEMLPEIDFSVIFTTAYDQYAARAFRISALDYLLKPVDSYELMVAVQKAEEKIRNNAGKSNIKNLLHNINQPAENQKIALPNADGYEFVGVSNILYCAAEGSYCRIIFKEKKPVLVSRTLGDIEEMLPPELFIRIHHSTIVNKSHVTQYSRADGGYVLLSNQEKLTISKSRKEAVLHQLGLK